MDPAAAAIEVAAVRWEQWIGAAQQRARFDRLLIETRPARPRARPGAGCRGPRASFLWMFAISALGYWLLRA